VALEPAIVAYTKTKVTGVSDRVYAVKAPQDATLPYIVFNITSNNFIADLGQDYGLNETRVTFNVYGSTYASVKGVVESLKSTYRNYISGVESVKMSNLHWVQATQPVSEIDLYEDGINVYRTALDVMFWHKE
jgi:hypothetical protein